MLCSKCHKPVFPELIMIDDQSVRVAAYCDACNHTDVYNFRASTIAIGDVRRWLAGTVDDWIKLAGPGTRQRK